MTLTKKILITGGAGFIGTHLHQFLKSKGYRTIIVDIKNGHQYDILHKEKLDEIFRQTRPDYVVHLAALTSKKDGDADKVTHINVDGTGNVVALSKKYNIKKIIFASSASVYRQINSYAKSKALGEKIIKTFPNYAILRLANVYGKGQKDNSEGGVVAIFAKAFKYGRKIVIRGTGRQTRDFIHVDDVLTAIEKAINAKNNLNVNIATGKSVSIIYLYKIMCDITNRDPGVIYKNTDTREIFSSSPGTLSAAKILRFKSRINLRGGIKKILGYPKV